jgi:hypothetical protein
VNAQNIEGNTPLHKAVRVDNLEIAKELLACGADLTIRGKEKKEVCHNDYAEPGACWHEWEMITPLDLARSKEMKALIKWSR